MRLLFLLIIYFINFVVFTGYSFATVLSPNYLAPKSQIPYLESVTEQNLIDFLRGTSTDKDGFTLDEILNRYSPSLRNTVITSLRQLMLNHEAVRLFRLGNQNEVQILYRLYDISFAANPLEFAIYKESDRMSDSEGLIGTVLKEDLPKDYDSSTDAVAAKKASKHPLVKMVKTNNDPYLAFFRIQRQLQSPINRPRIFKHLKRQPAEPLEAFEERMTKQHQKTTEKL